MAIIFDGRAFAAQKEAVLKQKVEQFREKGKTPKLTSILVGDDPASVLYVNLKRKAAERIGCLLEIIKLPAETPASEIINRIRKLNQDTEVDGVMIQLPLPRKLKGSTEKIICKIAVQKDVDGLRQDSKYLHPTSKAILQIIEVAEGGKNVCVVGSSGMVGRPLIKELKEEGYLVSECDSHTKNLKEKTLAADTVVSVTGKPNLIDEEMVRKGAVVIDVGSPQAEVDFERVLPKARFITPVPGGVGPVTISCLLENLVSAV